MYNFTEIVRTTDYIVYAKRVYTKRTKKHMRRNKCNLACIGHLQGNCKEFIRKGICKKKGKK